MTDNKYELNQKEKRIVNYDALHEAETSLGERGTDLSNSLGLMLHLQSVQEKRKVYASKGDTFFGCGLKYLHNNLLEHGYTLEINELFARSNYHEGQEDYFLIYAHDNGSVVHLDTYGKVFKIDDSGEYMYDDKGNSIYEDDLTINSGSLVFQWEPNEEMSGFSALDGCSHSVKILYNDEENENRHQFSNNELISKKGFFAGSKDIREGLFNKINELEKNGNFINKWINNSSSYMSEINIPEDVALHIIKNEKDVSNKEDVKSFILNKSEKLRTIFNNNIDNIDVLGFNSYQF